MADQPKGVTDLRPLEHQGPMPPTQSHEPGQIFFGDGVDPQAAAYAAGMAARQQARQARQGQPPIGIPKYVEPVGGGHGPPIPRLNAPFAQGATMAEQAEHTNSPPLHSQVASAISAQAPGSIVEPAMAPHEQQRAPDPVRDLGLQTGDMLPEAATKDPAYMTGTGATFAVSQPMLAARYGVIRNGQHIAPQGLAASQQSRGSSSPQSQLRPETLDGLKALQAHKQPASEMPEVSEDLGDSSAAHSSRVGRNDEEMTPEKKKEVEEAISKLDNFDYDTMRQIIQEDILNNPNQKKLIESRLDQLDIDELVMKNRLSQLVPIIVDAAGKRKFSATYTSMTGDEDLALKRLVMNESKSVEVTDRYLLDKFAFMALTCGVTAINNNPVPSHLDDKGDFSETKFWLKFNWVMKRPLHMLASIGCNHTWFEQRVRRLFQAEKLGNG